MGHLFIVHQIVSRGCVGRPGNVQAGIAGRTQAHLIHALVSGLHHSYEVAGIPYLCHKRHLLGLYEGSTSILTQLTTIFLKIIHRGPRRRGVASILARHPLGRRVDLPNMLDRLQLLVPLLGSQTLQSVGRHAKHTVHRHLRFVQSKYCIHIYPRFRPMGAAEVGGALILFTIQAAIVAGHFVGLFVVMG